MLSSNFRGCISRTRCLGLRLSPVFCQYRYISGLLFVPGEPLIVHPDDPTTLAVKNLTRHENRQLKFYEALERPVNTPSASIALSIISDHGALEVRGAEIESALPLIPRDFSDLEAAEAAEAAELAALRQWEDEYELPPELQPVAMDDNITQCNDGPRITMPVDDIEDYDALDYRNTYLRYIFGDEETDNYSDDVVNAWIRADRDECSKGARPRFYKVYENLRTETAKALFEYYDFELPIVEYHDASPLTSSSSLSPVLLIYQIPDHSHQDTAHPSEKVAPKTEEQFMQMFRRYAYLTSDECYHRVTAFEQGNPRFPRWLIVQEFKGDVEFNDSVDRKKKEAAYWWSQNKWDGVLLEFFREKQSVIEDLKSGNMSTVKGQDHEASRE